MIRTGKSSSFRELFLIAGVLIYKLSNTNKAYILFTGVIVPDHADFFVKIIKKC